MNSFKPSALKIATMTCICKLNTNIDIKILGKFLKINKIIKEIKYRNWIKTESTITPNKKPAFYNQITVVLAAGSNWINMKLFPNGQVQMTGCKNIDDVSTALNNITQEIYNINNVYCIPVFIEHNLIIGHDNVIFSHNSKNNIIGYKLSSDKYSLFNEEVVPLPNTNYFISNTTYPKQKIKNIYNSSGIIVGTQFLEFFSSQRTKFKNIHIRKGVIYNSKKEQIGSEIQNITRPTELIDLSSVEKLVCRFVAAEKNSIAHSSPQIVNINSVYDCNCELDREELHHFLHSQEIFSKFDPNTYPGVNIKFISNDYSDGICHCDTPCRWVNGKPMGENTCKRISIFVFQSGKIIITGGNSLHQINQAYSFINSIIQNNSSIIKQPIILPAHYYDNLMRFVD
jgi:TATA-box binding protein (TBP) (component of TFIID and TFIIIB)